MTFDTRQVAMLEAMGIRTWAAPAEPTPPPPIASAPAVRTASPPPAGPVPTQTAPAQAAPADHASALDWPSLQQIVADCRQCGLCKARKQTVFGVGGVPGPGLSVRADWVLVGEAPGEQEDLQGEPFVGPAGKLLDQMLAAIGLSRHKPDGGGVYILNTIKCRPPGNRNPSPEELVACAPHLKRQLELLSPKVIVAMGRFAAQSLLATTTPDVDKQPLGRLRGQVHRHGSVPVVVTYHPAYLLRNLPDKAKAWEDLVLATQVLRQGA